MSSKEWKFELSGGPPAAKRAKQESPVQPPVSKAPSESGSSMSSSWASTSSSDSGTDTLDDAESYSSSGSVTSESSSFSSSTESTAPPAGRKRKVPPPRKETPGEGNVARRKRSLAAGGRFSRSLEKDRSGRFVMAMRHGERLDRIFPEWTRRAFDGNGLYRMYDLNQPLQLIAAGRPVADYEADTPLTETGAVQSQMVGRALRICRAPLVAVYCSPALRCLQTAYNVLRSMPKGTAPRVRVEPGLFEWTAWYEQPPNWLEPAAVLGADRWEVVYRPLIGAEQLTKSSAGRCLETADQYYDRCRRVTEALLRRHSGDAGVVLLIGHSSTADACLRPLMGLRGQQTAGQLVMDQGGNHYPYCSTVILEESLKEPVVWRLCKPPPLPPITTIDFTNRIDYPHFMRA